MAVDTSSLEQPRTAGEVLELVAAARAGGRTLEILGGGTKRGVGAAGIADRLVSLSKLDAVIDYAPEELVLTAQAGVTIRELERLVAAKGQMLPFEPPHFTGGVGARGEPTLGGVLAANLSGPRRIRAGAARDHLLGFEAVTGRAESMKAGGKVVKNVTGYDLSKLMAGSWGTLAVLTEVTIKVLPAPRTETTLLLHGLDARRACLAMGLAMNAPMEVSGAAHLPASTAALAPLKTDLALTALRLEGFEASVESRATTLTALLREFGRADALDADQSRAFWAQVREIEAFQSGGEALWRISVPPASGWRVGETLSGDILFDWAGGLVWARTTAEPELIHDVARSLGGHALRYRGPASRHAPLGGPLAALSARVKAAFDPDGILNPGRMPEA